MREKEDVIMGDRFDYDIFLRKVRVNEYEAMKYKRKFILND